MPDSYGFIFAEGSSEYSLRIMIGVRGVNYIDLEGNPGTGDMWLGNHLYISSSKNVLDQNVKGVAIYHDYQSLKEIYEPTDQNGYVYTSTIYETLTTTLNFRSNVDFYLFVEYPTGTYYFDMKCSPNYYGDSTLYTEHADEIDTSKALTYQEYAYGEQITSLINRSNYTEDEYTKDGLLFTNWDIDLKPDGCG